MNKLSFDNPPIANEDWAGCNENDLDEQYAYYTYYGLTYRGFLENIKNHSIMERCFELFDLPPIPFNYYLLMFINYFMSDDFDLKILQNEYMLGLFFEMLIERVKEIKILVNIWDELNQLLILVKNDKKYSLYEDDTYQDLINKVGILENLKKAEDGS